MRGPSSNSTPKVSWLLCTNRDDALLNRAIQSCLSQTMRDFELIVVVNGIDHDQVLRNLSQRYAAESSMVILGTPIHLLNFSLSMGLHHARSPYVARIDADDVAAPDRLERQWTYMEQHPEVAVLGSSYKLIDSNNRIHGEVNCPLTDAEIRRQLYYRNPICHPSVMLRREVIQEAGGYLGGQNAEDYDLWLRLLLQSKFEFANLPEKLISYNVSLDGLARRSRIAYANVAAAQVRNFLISRNPLWIIGATISSTKSVFRAARS